MMDVIRLNAQHDVSHWAGQLPTDAWVDRVIEGNTLVLKPDGSSLLAVLRGVIAGPTYRDAYEAVAPLARSNSWSYNRGIAAGQIQEQEDPALFNSVPRGGQIGERTRVRYQPVKRDGTISKTVYAKASPSFLLGMSERSPRFPYCRQTVYSMRQAALFAQAFPVLQRCSQLFAIHAPDRYVAQRDACAATHPCWVIPGTVFTTLTVNRNWQTAFHTDAGDLVSGFGVMLCLRSGAYQGGLYVMPEYRVAVDLQAGDVLLSDVHCIHGNTSILGDPARYERITVVCYYRANMIACGSPAEELLRVKQVRGRLVP